MDEYFFAITAPGLWKTLSDFCKEPSPSGRGGKMLEETLLRLRFVESVCWKFLTIASGKKETLTTSPIAATVEQDPSDVGQITDVEELAGDQIQELISRRFRGHKLAELVDGVLNAKGYTTLCSRPGPDGGVDILAGNGTMGFDSPHLCVQVKSSDSPADVGLLRELIGTMKTKNADHGLLVSWGGFKETVRKEGTSSFFQISRLDCGTAQICFPSFWPTMTACPNPYSQNSN
jgi:predicted Mrr-cat superfamily restriction endonuclease